jgi:hypothetical protein
VHLLLSGLFKQEPSALAAAISKRPVKEHIYEPCDSMHIRHVTAVYTASTAALQHVLLSQIRSIRCVTRNCLDNVLAAEGLAKSILREEIGPACFNAHMRTFSLDARSSASRATARRTGGAETKMSGSIELGHRNKRHGAPGGTGRVVACPLAAVELLVGLAG